MFGKGTFVSGKTETIFLTENDVRSTSYSNGYARGSERVSFAGFGDWRLPTLEEWWTIQFVRFLYENRPARTTVDAIIQSDADTQADVQTLFPGVDILYDGDCNYFWSATGKSKRPRQSNAESLFGRLARIFNDTNDRYEILAWAMSFSRHVDLSHDKNELPVLLVRGHIAR